MEEKAHFPTNVIVGYSLLRVFTALQRDVRAFIWLDVEQGFARVRVRVHVRVRERMPACGDNFSFSVLLARTRARTHTHTYIHTRTHRYQQAHQAPRLFPPAFAFCERLSSIYLPVYLSLSLSLSLSL